MPGRTICKRIANKTQIRASEFGLHIWIWRSWRLDKKCPRDLIELSKSEILGLWARQVFTIPTGESQQKGAKKMRELHANPNVITKLKAEAADLEGKIDRLRAFMHKHIDEKGNQFDLNDDFFSDYYQAQRRCMEKQLCAMTCYLKMLNERIEILERDGAIADE